MVGDVLQYCKVQIELRFFTILQFSNLAMIVETGPKKGFKPSNLENVSFKPNTFDG